MVWRLENGRGEAETVEQRCVESRVVVLLLVLALADWRSPAKIYLV